VVKEHSDTTKTVERSWLCVHRLVKHIYEQTPWNIWNITIFFNYSKYSQGNIMHFEPIIEQQQQQVSREELARSKQAIAELQHHYNTYEAQLRMLQSSMNTQEDAVKYASLMLELNRCRDSLNRHITAYNQLIQLADVQFPTSRLSDQAKKEIYHLYHSGRYNQIQLASHYGIQQSTVSKIINGPQPS
jgi:hypothetical protein